MAVSQATAPRSRGRVGWGYLVAVLGPTVTCAGYVAVRDLVDPGILAMVLVPSVLGAAVLGGRLPAAGALALSFMGLDLFHEPSSGWPRLDLQEVELLVGFVVVAVVAVALLELGLHTREQQVRAETRWSRLSRVLEAVAVDVSSDQLVPLVEHELTDELELELARYEPEPRTTCDYHVGRHGGLHHDGRRLSEQHLHLPAEPVRIRVEHQRRDFGQMVLVPRRSHAVSEDQLLLAANLVAVLAEKLDEDSDAHD